MTFKHRLRLAAAAALCLSGLGARGQITVSGSNLQASGQSLQGVLGTPAVLINNATISFAPVDLQGHPLSFRAGTGGQVVTRAISAQVINGGFSVSLPDTSLTNPANVCFAVTVRDNLTRADLLGPGYSCVQPSSAASASSWCSGSSCNFDAYIPNTPGLPVTTVQGGTSTTITATAPLASASTSGTVKLAPGQTSPVLSAAATTGNAGDLAGTLSLNPALSYWYAAFHSCRSQIVRVGIDGDSRNKMDSTSLASVAGLGTYFTDTFGNRWPDLLQATLQSSGFCPSHGTGFNPLVSALNVATLDADFYTSSGGEGSGAGTWAVSTALGPYEGGANAGGTLVVATGALTITLHTPIQFDHLNAMCATGPGWGAWTMIVDGSSVGTCGGSSSSPTAVLAQSSAFTLGTHTASITCATGSTCAAYALEASVGTVGLSVDNYAVGGSVAENVGLTGATTQHVFSDLAPGGYALRIVQFVANQPASTSTYPPSDFLASLGNIITHARAQSYPASVLLMAPVYNSFGGQAAFYPAIAQAAQTYSTAFVDMTKRWGTGVVPMLFNGDQSHEDNMGHAEMYSAVASAVIDVPFSGSFSVSAPAAPTFLTAAYQVCTNDCYAGAAIGQVFANFTTQHNVILPPVPNASGSFQSSVVTVTAQGSSAANVYAPNGSTVTPTSPILIGSGCSISFVSTYVGATPTWVQDAYFCLTSSGLPVGQAAPSAVDNESGTTSSFVAGMPKTDSRFTVAVSSTGVSGAALIASVHMGEVWSPNCVASSYSDGNAYIVGADVMAQQFTYNGVTYLALRTTGSGLPTGNFAWNISCAAN